MVESRKAIFDNYIDALDAQSKLIKAIGKTASFEDSEPSGPSKVQWFVRSAASLRLQIILINYRWILSHLSEGRTEPVQNEESALVNLHLNSLYLHIRGVLDNLAWAIIWKVDPVIAASEEASNNPKVGLFREDFIKKLEGNTLHSVLVNKREWNRDLKVRRDPAAHRMPLFVPTIMTQEEITQHADLLNKSMEQVLLGDFEESERLMEKAYTVGSFKPYFGHSVDSGVVEIYPTIPNDCTTLAELTLNIIDQLNSGI